MELDDLVSWIRSNLADVHVVVASEENGAPEGSWGDVFVMHDVPADTPRRVLRSRRSSRRTSPASTIDPGERAGAFRVNIQVGRERADELLGRPPARSDPDDVDFAEADRLLPHPVYSPQGDVSVVNPGDATTDLVCQLLQEAHARSHARIRKRM